MEGVAWLLLCPCVVAVTVAVIGTAVNWFLSRSGR